MKKFMNEREDLKEYVNEEVWDYGREISNSKKAIFTTFSPFFFAQRKLPKVTRLLASWRFSKAYRITVFENHRKSLIASEASYVYILIGQKFIKNAKNGQFWRILKTLQSKSVTRQVTFKLDKKWWKMPKLKIRMRHFE